MFPKDINEALAYLFVRTKINSSMSASEINDLFWRKYWELESDKRNRQLDVRPIDR